ncbi:DeoR/GlpR family DNA-binding transcription regulator [Bauldia litoralis]|uniref:Transcriptional regulator, DeoR family n=1 Tax=Bauldia litoralis TaxID=665467 RepID=A0A1G6CAT3_9HYPH|nr:DeoR/GlpR family DNA-binding transcription regulator [Bauldia litoralis]SDB30028.1 transcriptional regulator, DeoR family [Bauldia litoralis]
MTHMLDQDQDESKRLLGRVRKERMTEMIRRRGFMSSSALAAEFGVSEMTVRRDLAELTAQGILIRTHGGAMWREEEALETKGAEEPFFDARMRLNREAKSRIAKSAERLVQKGQAVALDLGTTTYELADRLANRNEIRIITNNLRIATMLASYPVDVYLLGGHVRQNEMSLCGPVAVQQAGKFRFDIAFLGVAALSQGGIYDYAIEEAELKQAFLTQATRRVVLCDSSKFGRVSLVHVARLDAFDTLITDAAPPADIAAALAAAGVETIIAGPSAS